MDREEKVFEMALEALISRCSDIRSSLAAFIWKLENEYETLSWPSVLDSFALLSGQISTMMKILKNDKTPPLRNRVLLPLLLSPDRDEELAKLTDNRVQAFNHDMVPDYLRTKPEPEVELKEQLLYQKASMISADAGQKQVTLINKIANNIIELVKSQREEWENESGQRANQAQTTSLNDTQTIIASIAMGKGLKSGPLPVTGSPKPGSQSQGNLQPGVQGGPKAGGPGKAPTLKTNIKSASSHPYGR